MPETPTTTADPLAAIPAPPLPPSDKPRPSGKRPTTRAGRAAARATKTAANGGKPDAAPAAAPKRQAQLQTRIAGFYTTIGIAVSMAQPIDGMVIASNAEACAAAWAKAAQQNPKIAEVWDRILGVSVVGELLAAHLPVALAIAANHGKVPSQLAAMMGGAPAAAPDLSSFLPPQTSPA